MPLVHVTNISVTNLTHVVFDDIIISTVNLQIRSLPMVDSSVLSYSRPKEILLKIHLALGAVEILLLGKLALLLSYSIVLIFIFVLVILIIAVQLAQFLSTLIVMSPMY